MARRRKLTRKQPRRLTPPLFLRTETERTCIQVDEELVLVAPHSSGCVRAYLQLGPGLHVQVGSRCVNKRRIPVLKIRRSDLPEHELEPFDLFQQNRAVMQGEPVIAEPA